MEGRAYRIVNYAVRHSDDAMDIVQDAMLRLASRYGDKPPEQWPALFYRILQNRIKDYHRRRTVSRRWLSWFDQFETEDGDSMELGPDLTSVDGERRLQLDRGMEELEQAINRLPRRQQQVFLLRCWEGLDTKQTAIAMGCSEGSVKTHYFRALNALKTALGEHWT